MKRITLIFLATVLCITLVLPVYAGVNADGGGATIVVNHDIKSYLGIATVVFYDDTVGDNVGGNNEDKDYVFRTDTDVIISTWVRAGANDITPDYNACVLIDFYTNFFMKGLILCCSVFCQYFVA